MHPNGFPCRYCNGTGRVLDQSRPVTEFDLPRYLPCSKCNGLGRFQPQSCCR